MHTASIDYLLSLADKSFAGSAAGVRYAVTQLHEAGRGDVLELIAMRAGRTL